VLVGYEFYALKQLLLSITKKENTMSTPQKFLHGKNHQSHLSMFIASLLLLLLALIYSSCSTSTTEATPSVASTANIQTYPVKVYFSKKTSDNPATVFPFNRVSPNSGVGTFAIQQLVAGPTTTESSAGYISAVHDGINGSSNCASHQDFTLTLNKKGTQDQSGTATLHFCRAIASAGIGDDARVISEVDSTLLQFSTIKKVIILTNTGHCLGDESGLDVCLK
jgi:spore germination protein GerM